MLNEKIQKDMKEFESGETTVDVQRLINSLRRYTGKVEITDEKELTSLFLLIPQIMDVPPETFDKMISRMHRILFKHKTGIDPVDIAEFIHAKQVKPEGPLQ